MWPKLKWEIFNYTVQYSTATGSISTTYCTVIIFKVSLFPLSSPPLSSSRSRRTPSIVTPIVAISERNHIFIPAADYPRKKCVRAAVWPRAKREYCWKYAKDQKMKCGPRKLWVNRSAFYNAKNVSFPMVTIRDFPIRSWEGPRERKKGRREHIYSLGPILDLWPYKVNLYIQNWPFLVQLYRPEPKLNDFWEASVQPRGDVGGADGSKERRW